MKQNVLKGLVIMLAILVVVGCMNPFNSGRGSESSVSGTSDATVTLSVQLGDEIGASKFLSEDGEVQSVRVEVVRYDDGMTLDIVELEHENNTWSHGCPVELKL